MRSSCRRPPTWASRSGRSRTHSDDYRRRSPGRAGERTPGEQQKCSRREPSSTSQLLDDHLVLAILEVVVSRLSFAPPRSVMLRSNCANGFQSSPWRIECPFQPAPL
jgi:hypothetical protein